MPAITYAGYMAINWTPFAICTAITGLRLYIRAKLRIFGVEDYLMAASWLLLTVSMSLYQATESTYFYNQAAINTIYWAKDHAELVLLYISSLFAKGSVAALLLHLVGFTSCWRRILIIACIALFTLITLMVCVVIIVPPCAWNESTIPNGACVPETAIVVGISTAWNFTAAFVDIVYSVLPLTIFYRLRTTLAKKTCVMFLMSLGWLTATCAILRAIGEYVWDDTQVRGRIVQSVTSALEPPLVIICGSLGTLAPMAEYWGKGRAMGPPPPQLPDGPGVDGRYDYRGLARDLGDEVEDGGYHGSLEMRQSSADGLLPPIRILKRISIDVSSDKIM